jgi:outer membrane protein OmpA-like peptidoglycan-associated protein
MSCQCDEEEICEECPEWIFTLADLLMCMMGLFVLLWVLKPDGGGAGSSSKAQADESRQIEIIAAIREKFGYVPDGKDMDPVDLWMLRKEFERQATNGPGEKGNAKLKPNGAEGTEPEVTTVRPGDFYTDGGHLTFAPGSASLTAKHLADLEDVAKRIRGHKNVVLIKGHAAPDDSAFTDDLMALSLRRAQAVADTLEVMGVAADTIRVQGCGPHEPLVRRAYDDETRAANRRVEVEATDKLITEMQAPPVLAPR